MSECELPPPALRVRDTPHEVWDEGDYFSAEQMRAFYAKGVRAGMERSIQLCEPVAFEGCHEWRRSAVDKCIAAIRAETPRAAIDASGGKGDGE